MRSSQKQLILPLFAGSESAWYTFEALTSGVVVQAGPGGGGGGGVGDGEGGGGGDGGDGEGDGETAGGGGDEAAAHW